jgi:hypothetical protein
MKRQRSFARSAGSSGSSRDFDDVRCSRKLRAAQQRALLDAARVRLVPQERMAGRLAHPHDDGSSFSTLHLAKNDRLWTPSRRARAVTKNLGGFCLTSTSVPLVFDEEPASIRSRARSQRS